jgi:hypothetical protein
MPVGVGVRRLIVRSTSDTALHITAGSVAVPVRVAAAVRPRRTRARLLVDGPAASRSRRVA